MRWLYVMLVAFPLHATADCDALMEEAGRISHLLNNDPAAGLEQAQDGIALAHEAGCTKALAAMHAAHGDSLNVLGRRDDARDAYAQALALLDDFEEGSIHASVLRRFAINRSQAGEFDVSLERFLRSLAISESLGDRAAVGHTAGNIGTLLSQAGELERARVYFERALAAHEEAGDVFGTASVTINLGTLHLRMADRERDEGDGDAERALRERALRYNLEALELFEGLDNLRGIASASTNAGTTEWQLGRSDRALPHHLRALSISERTGHHIGQFTAHLQLANVYVALRRFAEAQAHLETAEELANGSPLAHRAGVAEAWVGLEEARGDHAAALAHQREVTRLQSRIAEEDHRSRLAEMEMEYEAQRREQEIELLHNEGDITRLRLERQELILRVGAIITLLLLALSGVIYNRYRVGVNAARELERAARTDSLTGMSNRRDIQERIEYELQRSRRNAKPFSLLMVDLDGFKVINDTRGHSTGDEILAAAAVCIDGTSRALDTVARWGGDEFIMLLPETDEKGAAKLAEKIRRAFDALPLVVDGERFMLTVTIGVAQSWPGKEAEELISAADRAMYKGKRDGRNQVVVERVT